MAASTAISSICELRLVCSAHCGGRAPTCTGSKPCLVTQTGTSTQAPWGRLVTRPVFGTLPLNLKGSPPFRALMMCAAYSWPRSSEMGVSCANHLRASSFQVLSRFWYSFSTYAYSPGFQPVPCVQYFSLRSGRLRNHQLYSELCPLDSVT